jgi:hypothetical protein
MKVHRADVTASYLGGTRVQFTCPHGHATVRDYAQGPASDRMNETSVQRFVMMWDTRIKIPFTCRKCPPVRPRLRPASMR